jgi:hypothetical protein
MEVVPFAASARGDSVGKSLKNAFGLIVKLRQQPRSTPLFVAGALVTAVEYRCRDGNA